MGNGSEMGNGIDGECDSLAVSLSLTFPTSLSPLPSSYFLGHAPAIASPILAIITCASLSTIQR